MAWTTPVDQTTGHLVTAAEYNAQIIDNLKYLHGDSGDFNIIAGLTATGGSGIGYATGSGGTGSVTQANAGTTGVTINKTTGQLTVTSLSLATSTALLIKLVNSLITTSDVLSVSIEGADAPNTILTGTGISASGTAWISVYNLSGGTLSSNLLINFVVLKGATS